MLEYDEKIEASKRFVNRRWYAADREWHRAPVKGHWTTIVPLGDHRFEILVERDDEVRNRVIVRRKLRCSSLTEAKEFAWTCLEPRLDSFLESQPRHRKSSLRG